MLFAVTSFANTPTSQVDIQQSLIQKLCQHLQHKTRFEFIQTAKSGTIEPVVGQANHYTLTLKGVNAYLIYFSDRPKHITGMISPKDYYHIWSNGSTGYSKNPPNAVLESELLQSNDHVLYVFELSNPQYNAGKNTVTYAARLISKKMSTIQSKQDVGFTTLFIDDYAIHWHGHIP